MRKGTGGSGGSRPNNLSDLGQEPGSEGISLFGISLGRVVKIPLQRWKLSLLVLVLCTGAAILYAKIFSRSFYELSGTLIHRPAGEQKDVPAPRTLETLMEELKSPHYYKQLNEKFDMAIPPENFVRIFDVKRGIENSHVIEVRLKWEDSGQGADLVNHLMKLHREEVERYRRSDLERARQATTEALTDCDGQLKAAMKRRDDYLRGKQVSNPKEKLAEIGREISRVDAQIDAVEAEHNKLKSEIAKVVEDIEGLKNKKDKDREPLGEDDSAEAYRQRKTQLEIDLITLKQELTRAQSTLRIKEKEYAVKKPLADEGIIIQSVIRELDLAIAGLRGDTEAARKKIDIRTRELNELRPGNARLRRLLVERSALQLKQTTVQRDEGRYKLQRENQRKRAEEMEGVEKEWAPLDREVKQLQKERDDLRGKQAELDLRLRNVAPELEIGSPAAPSISPISNARKQMMLGFLVPMLVCFGAMVALDMASTAWRAETLAEKLRLPVLARPSPGRRRAGQATELSPDECRGLSLRIRQFVPEDGAVVLISSLNDGPGVDPLVSGVSRYLGMRNERALILDARIAQAAAPGLTSLIERQAGGNGPQVVPSVAGAGGSALGPVGLVQSLVFERQNWSDFTHHTRMAGVDYFPAGGPYPMTDALASEPMEELLKALRKRYTIILLVGPALSRSVDTEILAAFADGMIVVINEPLSSSSPEVEELVAAIEEAKPALLLGSVVCL